MLSKLTYMYLYLHRLLNNLYYTAILGNIGQYRGKKNQNDSYQQFKMPYTLAKFDLTSHRKACRFLSVGTT